MRLSFDPVKLFILGLLMAKAKAKDSLDATIAFWHDYSVNSMVNVAFHDRHPSIQKSFCFQIVSIFAANKKSRERRPPDAPCFMYVFKDLIAIVCEALLAR